MAQAKITRYFLGANSRYGFRSLYQGFCKAEDDCFLHVIKGGPGCGKSSFMGRIGSAAEAEGLDVEYIHCSGDPDSLDGVYIPALGVGYVDGTAPHALDPALPGCGGMYLDLGRFYNSAALRPDLSSVAQLSRRYKGLYAAAYSSIAAAAAAMPRCVPGLCSEEELEKIYKKAGGFAKREFKGPGGAAHCSEKFIDALSCRGRVFMSDTVNSLCERVCILDNELGLGHIFLSALLPHAGEKGLSAIVCRDCIDPELIFALLMPEISLAVICAAPGQEFEEAYRRIRLDSIPCSERLKTLRPLLRQSKRLSRETLSLSCRTLEEAKALHDELEAIYNSHVDFDGVYGEARRHIRALFGHDSSF